MLFMDEIKLHESIGDLRAKGFDLHFNDYEGVESFRRAIYRRGVASTRAYVSVQSVINKIDRAVVKCCTRQGRQ